MECRRGGDGELEMEEKRWEMEFHPSKCSTLPVTRKRQPLDSSYQLHDQTLETVKTVKYLGVTLQHELKWDSHISSICSKANKTLGFLRRNLKIKNSQLKEVAYKTYVRPILEYSSTVWDPSFVSHTKQLEAVQRTAARFVLHRYHNRSSVTDMIATLGWTSLEQRRKSSKLCMMYKILHDQVHFSKSKIEPAPIRNRRGNSQQLKQLQCRTAYRQASFLPSTIREWNALPEYAVAAGSLDTFVSRIC